jgi:hypothetical protein
MIQTGKFVRYVLGMLLAFGALNALGGGYYGLCGAPGVPVEWLAGSPFEDYFVPSMILFVVVGGTLAFAALAVLAGFRVARRSAFVAGATVLGRIIVQMAIIGYVSWSSRRPSSVGWPCWGWPGSCRRSTRAGRLV